MERPRNREHGDWATNVALQLAKAAGRPPREVADALAARLRRRRRASRASTSPARASSTSPSTPPRPASWPARSSRPGAAYGRGDAEAGHRINLEFVSANPTGPIHLGGTRWAAVGDALARILAGRRAPRSTREYYFNDHGAQIDRFARSLLAARQGRAGPRGRLRRRLHRRHRRRGSLARRARTILDLPDDEAQERLPRASAST